MASSTSASRFQWTQTLETFIRQRLVDRSGEGSPFVLTNSQFVIDGIVMAINDHPSEHGASLVAVRNVVEAYGRELVDGSRPVATVALNLYLAWCVFDAMLKNTTIAELHEAACANAPSLVAVHMPLFIPPHSPRERQAEAAAEYGELFASMLRSWVSSGVLPQATQDACADALSQQIQQYQSEVQFEDGAAGAGQQEAQGAVVAKILAGQGTAMASLAGKASGMGAINTVMNGFYAITTGREVHQCLDCGLQCPTPEALREHKAYHRYLQAEPNRHLRRLLAPSVDAFCSYSGEASQSQGAYVRIAATQDAASTMESARIRL